MLRQAIFSFKIRCQIDKIIIDFKLLEFTFKV